MSHFYATIRGNRGEASRCGSKDSGIRGHIRGWGVGASVYLDHDNEAGEDKVTIYLTSGSNGYSSSKLLGTFTRKNLGRK